MHRIYLFVLFCAVASCDPKGGTPNTPSGGKSGKSVACYVADQFVCHEYPAASDEKADAAAVVCSSASGVPSGPAACPHDAFKGKCTSDESGSTKVERFYTGADVPYAQDFCVNTAHGTWSTTF